MGRFFSVEGKFFTACSKIVDMVILTLLWIVGCIPIVTIVTSTSSLYHATVKCVRFERGKAYQEFMDAYKKNFKQGVGLTILYGGIGAAIGYLDYHVFFLSQTRTMAVFIMAVFMLIMTVLYLMNVLWLIPVFSRFSNTFGFIVQLNFVIAIKQIVRSIPMLLIAAVSLLLMWVSPPLAILFPSLGMLVISYLSEPGLRKYMPRQTEDNGDWRYGFK